MATRTALLNGNVINRDTDFSKYIETISEPGVISGFAVSSSSVAVGKARVPCERTNGDIIYALVYNNSAQDISGDGDVYIKVSQELIDNGELANEDGTGIATIEVGTMPAKNALKLATKSGSTITDARNMIKKSGELLALINTNTANISSLDTRVEHLEEAGAINHLEQSGIIGEKYTLSDTLFRQFTPTYSDSTYALYVGSNNNNKQIHIQRIGSGTASNQLELKVRKYGSPTTNLVVEVRKGTKVDVNSTEAYWYGGGDLVASGSISYSNISTSLSLKTITLNANFGGTKGELLDIVVYQTNNTVNSSNYFAIGCDSTQYSEAFSYVAVNGTTRNRSKRMPFCTSNGFLDSLICKTAIGNTFSAGGTIESKSGNSISGVSGNATICTITTTYPYYAFNYVLSVHFDSCGYYRDGITVNGTSAIGLSSGTNSQKKQTDRTATSETLSSATTAPDNTFLIEKTGTASVSYFTNPVVRLLTTEATTLYFPRKDNFNLDITGVPVEVKSIGQLGSFIFEGINDTDYVGAIVTGKTTSATTGSVTLGNAVGFLTVNLNGQVVKIPYYGN